MTIRSMTGYGAASGQLESDRLDVEIRSVNHRFFNPSLRIPGSWSRFEKEIREILHRRVHRGHVTLTAQVSSDGTRGGHVDRARFASWLEQLRAVAAAHDIAVPIDVGTVVRLPDVISTEEPARTLDDPAPILETVERAVASFDATRMAEGEKIAGFIRDRLALTEDAIRAIAERAPARLVQHRDRLRSAVRELAETPVVDEQRLAQEIAILADRLDVSEEIERFTAHLEAFRSTLDDPPQDGVGKRLGFLLQELLREANTTGSKAADTELVRRVLLIKEELERIREQVENLE